jgi:hypothetical protein
LIYSYASDIFLRDLLERLLLFCRIAEQSSIDCATRIASLPITGLERRDRQETCPTIPGNKAVAIIRAIKVAHRLNTTIKEEEDTVDRRRSNMGDYNAIRVD